MQGGRFLSSPCAVVLLCSICGHLHTILPTLILRFFFNDRTISCILALLASFADQIMPACILVLLAQPSVIARRQYNLPPSPPLNSYLHFILWIHIMFQKYEFIRVAYQGWYFGWYRLVIRRYTNTNTKGKLGWYISVLQLWRERIILIKRGVGCQENK